MRYERGEGTYLEGGSVGLGGGCYLGERGGVGTVWRGGGLAVGGGGGGAGSLTLMVLVLLLLLVLEGPRARSIFGGGRQLSGVFLLLLSTAQSAKQPEHLWGTGTRLERYGDGDIARGC